MTATQTGSYDSLLNGLIFIIVLCMAAFIAFMILRARHRNNQGEQNVRRVVIVDLKTSASGNAMQGIISRNTGPLTQAHEKFKATVQSEDGDCQEFYIDSKTYGKIRVGEKGTLTTRGGRWILFEE